MKTDSDDKISIEDYVEFVKSELEANAESIFFDHLEG